MDTGRYGEGGHYVMKPEAASLLRSFMPIKHGFEDKKTTLDEAIQLPRGVANRDNPQRGIKDGNLLLSQYVVRTIFNENIFSLHMHLGLIYEAYSAGLWIRHWP